MNITIARQYFWGGTVAYTPTSLEYCLFIINNMTWWSIILIYYCHNRKKTDRYVPTYSYMVKDYPAYYVHFTMWLFGFIIRMICIAQRLHGKGLCMLMPFLIFCWLGTSLIPVKEDGILSTNGNRIHVYFASCMFCFFYILVGFFCKYYLYFQIKFALLLISSLCPWNQYIMFSIMEHICVYHVCIYSYPIIMN